MQKLTVLFYSIATLLFGTLFTSCNNGGSTTDSSDSTITTDTSSRVDNNPNDDVVFFKNCHKSSDTGLSTYLESKPSDTAALYTYTSDVYVMTMSGEEFLEAVSELNDDIYDYLSFDFSRKNPFYLTLEGFSRESTTPRTQKKLTQTDTLKTITSTKDVRGQRWWVRRAIICKEAAAEFISRIKSKYGINLLDEADAKKVYVVIRPKLDEDEIGQYVSLVLSIEKKEDAKATYSTSLKTNPCPVCPS